MARLLAGAFLVSLAAASQPETVIRGMKHPALSPDGDWLAFSWHGDLWMCSRIGGPARRLTDDPADEQKPAWSPDGRQIAFSSDKNSSRDIYVLDLSKKQTRQLTWHSAHDDSPAWSPDGKWIAFQSNRDSNLDLALNDDVYDVWRMPAAGGTASRVTRFRGENPSWSPDGKWIAYDRYATGYADGEHNIFLIAPDGTGVPREIASGGEDSRRPTFRGSTIYFAHAAMGPHNIWKTSTAGGALVQVTGLKGDHATWPTTCGKTDHVVFEFDFDLYSLPLGDRTAKPQKLRITTDSLYKDSPITRTLTAGARSPAWSPDGKRVAFALEGDLWTVSAEGGPATQITRTLEDERDVAWSSDGSALVYVSDRHVFRLAATGGAPEQLTREPRDYSAPRLHGSLLASAAAGIIYLGDRPLIDGACPAFSPDGKRLAYIAGGKKIMMFDIEAKTARERPSDDLPKSALTWSPDGKTLAYVVTDRATSRIFLMADGKPTALAAGNAPSWSPDSSMILHDDGRRFVIRDVYDPTTKIPLPYTAERTFTLKWEMLALFEQVWNVYESRYYDPFFHGVDWKAMRDKYASLAAEARTGAEIHEIINDMIRELQSSHVHLTPPPARPLRITYALAADLEPLEDGTVKIAGVEPGGPAAKSGLKPGDRIVAVGETDLKPGVDLDRLLSAEGEAPEFAVAVRNSENEVQTRHIKGLTRSALRVLKYDNSIARHKALVKEKSNGRLGYFHIKYMGQPEVTRLKTALEKEYPEAEGLVFDIRDGVGGMAHRPVIQLLDSTAGERLSKKPACSMRNRDGSVIPDRFPATTTGKSWDRPVIVIQNEVSRSDKEILPYTFMAARVGWTVGMPTAGGVIGGNEMPLRDGSRITVSVQGWFTSEGRNMEGWGVPPDFRVPLTHEALYAGRDPQLEKAIEIVLAQLDGKLAPPLEKPKSGGK